VKNCIVEIDSAEFKKWYETHYGVALNKKGAETKEAAGSKSTKEKYAERQKERVLDPLIEAQLVNQGRLLACISSRPGQCGRCDGYVLEGKELEFYQRMLSQKKKGKAKEKA